MKKSERIWLPLSADAHGPRIGSNLFLVPQNSNHLMHLIGQHQYGFDNSPLRGLRLQIYRVVYFFRFRFHVLWKYGFFYKLCHFPMITENHNPRFKGGDTQTGSWIRKSITLSSHGFAGEIGAKEFSATLYPMKHHKGRLTLRNPFLCRVPWYRQPSLSFGK